MVRKTKRLIGVVISIAGFVGLSLFLYSSIDFFVISGYLSQMSQRVSAAQNRSQVRTILRGFTETPVPASSEYVRAYLLPVKPGLTTYKYSFGTFINKNNCMLVTYDRSGRMLSVAEVFE
jgi:hypothetical protein